MKYLVLITSIFFNITILQAQTDVIYPTETTESIQGVIITNIENGNLIYYKKDSVINSVKASSVYRNGAYTELSEDVLTKALWKYPDNEYYSEQYTKSMSLRNLGIGLAVFGVSIGVAGYFIINKQYHPNHDPSNIGAAMYLGGGVITHVGAVLWITGGVKAINNKRALNNLKNTQNLSFGTTNNGMGFTFNF